MSNESVSNFEFDFRGCHNGIELFCDVILNEKNILMKRAYGWMHTCVSYDFSNKSMSVALDQQVVYTEASNDQFGFQSIRVSWDHWRQYTFPEMFTMLNIHTRCIKNS